MEVGVSTSAETPETRCVRLDFGPAPREMTLQESAAADLDHDEKQDNTQVFERSSLRKISASSFASFRNLRTPPESPKRYSLKSLKSTESFANETIKQLSEHFNKNERHDLNRKLEAHRTIAEVRADVNRAKSPKEEKWTQTTQFSVFIGFFVVLNAVSLGCEADYSEQAPMMFYALEHIFTAIFTLEVIAHFTVEGGKIYLSCPWNCFDFILVLLAIIEGWIIEPLGAEADMRLMTVLRLMRLVRLTRVLKVFRLFRELTLMMNGLGGSLRTLWWALLFLLAVVYGFALFAAGTMGKATECSLAASPGEPEQCEAKYTFSEDIGTQQELFGSVSRTMVTLFGCVTEGCSIDIIRPILVSTPIYVLFWIPFVFVTQLGMLNLIVGLICESALSNARQQQEEIEQEAQLKRNTFILALHQAFIDMDKDANGEVSYEEFMEAMESNPDMEGLMQELDLGDEANLFECLDTDQSGSMPFNEFFEGITFLVQGKRSANARDVVRVFLLLQGVQRKVKNIEQTIATDGKLRSEEIKNIEEKIRQETLERREDFRRLQESQQRIEANQEKVMQYLLSGSTEKVSSMQL